MNFDILHHENLEWTKTRQNEALCSEGLPSDCCTDLLIVGKQVYVLIRPYHYFFAYLKHNLRNCVQERTLFYQCTCFRANGGRVLVFGVHKKPPQTSIQHTVLEPSYQGIHLVFFFPSTLLIKQETEDKSCWLSKVLFIES